MNPAFNSLPYNSNQAQSNGTPTTAPQQQQVKESNKFQGNPSNSLPQIQSQMGLVNPQSQTPFNNSNAQFGNGNNPFMNIPNQFFQNGVLPFGQFPIGFGPQNLNNMAMNQFSMSQLSCQFFPPNSMNQNFSSPNGQFFIPGPMQNMGQFVQMQMPNMAFFQNQVSQSMGPQNLSFNGNQQLGVLNFNGIAQQANQEQKSSNPTRQLQGNSSSSAQPAFGSVQPQQTPNFRPQVFNNQQGNPRNDHGFNNMTNNGRNFQSTNFARHPRPNTLQGQAHHTQNAKGKFKHRNERRGKGIKNEWGRKFDLPDPSNGTQVQKKKPLPLNYTEQEIQQWREARKRHYPSKANLEKKSVKKMTESELADTEAKLRRQQLKDVLEKQAQLGCEVAEIPSHYLSDSEKQVHGADQNQRVFDKKGRHRNKFNKRGRRGTDIFSKKQRPSDTDPASSNNQNDVSKQSHETRNNDTSIVKKREPTLLQKLLSTDIRRDRDRLLQVFRFMVMNSFFKDQSEKPLRFPKVIVKETQSEGELAEQKSSSQRKEVCFGDNKDEKGDNKDEKGDDIPSEAPVNEMGNVGGIDKAFVGAQEEEGEIID